MAYAAFFPNEIQVILEEFDNWITVLTDVDTDHTAVKQQYLAYLRQYRQCLAETDVSKLEDTWRQLDVLWMQIRHPVQVQQNGTDWWLPVGHQEQGGPRYRIWLL